MNVLKAISLLATLLASTAISAAEPAPPLPMAQGKGFTQEGIAKIDSFFADQIASNQTPGAVLAVAKNGKLVIYKSYGYLDKASNKPMG